MVSVVAPDGALSTQSYTFFERTATDPQQRVRKIVQDADRRVVTAIDMHDGQPLETTYSYVHGSQPEWVIDPQSNMIHSVFDVRGRRTLLEDPDAGTRATKYDGFGDVVETGDGAGNTTTYTLDRIGRATTIESDTDGTTTLTWDTQPHGLGQIAQTVSPDHTIVDSYYDSIGRPTKTDWTVPGPVVSMFSFEQSYDTDGRVAELRYPYALNRSRMVVTPHYEDGAGGVSLIEATDALGSPFDVWKVADRNADNSLTAAKLGTSIETARSYDAVTGRLAGIATTAGTASIVDLAFDYYSDGRLHSRRDYAAGRTESFEYDDLRRLTAWSLDAHSVTNYEYDPLGNLTGVRDENGFQTEANGYTGDGPHQLNARDGVVFTYDERGRLYNSDDGLAIEYTDFDLPKSYTKDNVTTDFNYDAGHHRVRKAGPSGTTITLGGLYERREDAGGTKHVFNIGGPDGMIAQVVYDQTHASEEVEYLHQDQLGSVAVATSPGGKEIDRLFYEPFGRRIDKHGNLLSGPASDVLTGFTGQRHDDDLGLIDMRGRTYDPILRRFLQPDPVIQDAYEGQNYNRYSYVTNDPVNLIDPTGYRSTYKWRDGASGSIEEDGSGGSFEEARVVVTAPPESPADHLGTDNNGEGAAVQGEAALADTSYQSSSTDQGLNAGGGGGSGGGPATGPTGLCGGCIEQDFGSAILQYGPSVERNLLYMSGTAIALAGAMVYVPVVGVGSLLSAAGAAATRWYGAAVVAATTVASCSTTPTGQAVLAEVGEEEGPALARGPAATLELAQQIAKASSAPPWVRTVSLLETEQGPTLVGGGATDLSEAQKILAEQAGLTVVRDMPGLHAETTVLEGAAELGLTPTNGIATNNVCSDCSPYIQSIGC